MRRYSLPCCSRECHLALLLTLVSTVLLTQIAFATDVGGTIGSQTWTPAGNPYHVISDVTLPSAATLTIQPGVIEKFDLARTLTVQGTLSALGTVADSIVFTVVAG